MACVEKRGVNNYRITVYDGYNSQGRQVKKHITWKADAGMTDYQIKKELEKQKVLFEQECRGGQAISSAIKLKDFIDLWFEKYANLNLRVTTIDNYKSLSVRVNKALGHIRLDRINPNDLNKFYGTLMGCTPQNHKTYALNFDLKAALFKANLTYRKFSKLSDIGIRTVNSVANGSNVSADNAEKIARTLHLRFEDAFRSIDNRKMNLSSKTVKHYHGFLSSVFTRAVKWGYIKDNPCERVDPPKIMRKQIECLSMDEAKTFLKGLSQECLKYQVIFSLLLYTGLRRGELLGLEWSDINEEKKTISINRTSVYIRSKGQLTDTTKNEHSIRVISISDELLSLLKSYKAEQDELKQRLGDYWVDSDRICIKDDGSPMGVGTPYSILRKLLKKYNMDAVSLHSLRHTNATIMIEAGVDLKTTSARLGHSQTSTTMNIYVHEIKSAQEQAAETISRALAF